MPLVCGILTAEMADEGGDVPCLLQLVNSGGG